MSCRVDPDPWFLRELGVFFENPFSMEWNHGMGKFELYEYAQNRYNGTRVKYWIIGIYPYEQHRGTLELLRLSNIRQPWAKKQRFACTNERERMRRNRSKRLSAWLHDGISDVARAGNIASSYGGKKSTEKSWGEGFMKQAEAEVNG